METAVERWQAIIDERAQQMDAAYAELGLSSAGYWDRRARRYHASTKDAVVDDPLFKRLRAVITPQTSVLDVGAGSGRFALALAPLAKQIIAVEPNAAMLDYLRRDAQALNLTNISYSRNTWHEARLACYIYMRATPIDALTALLWKHFHGDDRRYPPGYIHALDILYEMGIYANVEVVSLPASLRYPSLDVAVEELAEQLILPDDDKTRDELRALLNGWLVERDGMLMPPPQDMMCAILWWAN